MERYEKGQTLGEGTFGVVVRATDRVTGLEVALKKIRLTKLKDGVNVTALREIKVLKELRSPHVVLLLDVFTHKRNLSLVFEYMESDLEAIIRSRTILLTPADIKSYMRMTLEGVKVCHENFIMHRDLKPNNLLIGTDGTLKLADFGLARIYGSPSPRLTTLVFARWYRAPELLFGAKKYGTAVDMWAVGCIFAELLMRRPLFEGTSDTDQLDKIFAVLGTPTDADWPGMRALPDYVEYGPVKAPPLGEHFAGCNAMDDALDFLSKLLKLNPLSRVSAAQALQHRYFRNEPQPTTPSMLPRPPARKGSTMAGTTAGVRGQGQGPVGGTENRKGNGREISEREVWGQGRNCTEMDLVDPSSKTTPLEAHDIRRKSEPMPAVANMVPDVNYRRGGSDVAMLEDVTPHSVVPMSTDTRADCRRPFLNTEDKAYLRKRKLEMDSALYDQEPMYEEPIEPIDGNPNLNKQLKFESTD